MFCLEKNFPKQVQEKQVMNLVLWRVCRKGFETLDLHFVEAHFFNNISLCLVGNIGVTNHFACVLVSFCCFRHTPHQLTYADFRIQHGLADLLRLRFQGLRAYPYKGKRVSFFNAR